MGLLHMMYSINICDLKQSKHVRRVGQDGLGRGVLSDVIVVVLIDLVLVDDIVTDITRSAHGS